MPRSVSETHPFPSIYTIVVRLFGRIQLQEYVYQRKQVVFPWLQFRAFRWPFEWRYYLSGSTCQRHNQHLKPHSGVNSAYAELPEARTPAHAVMLVCYTTGPGVSRIPNLELGSLGELSHHSVESQLREQGGSAYASIPPHYSDPKGSDQLETLTLYGVESAAFGSVESGLF